MQHASTLHQSQTPWKMSAPERISMFLWRIGVNVRAKENMLRRLEVTDSKCVLCGEEVKITCHIFFFKCLVAKAVWHSACWGFRTDEFWISSNEDIVNLVLNPPNLSCTANEIWLVSLIWLFTLQRIWCLCNHVLHNGGPADIYSSIHQIHYRFMEFSTLTNQSTRLPPPPSFASWVPPPTD